MFWATEYISATSSIRSLYVELTECHQWYEGSRPVNAQKIPVCNVRVCTMGKTLSHSLIPMHLPPLFHISKYGGSIPAASRIAAMTPTKVIGQLTPLAYGPWRRSVSEAPYIFPTAYTKRQDQKRFDATKERRNARGQQKSCPRSPSAGEN